jgi:hypothetical protein
VNKFSDAIVMTEMDPKVWEQIKQNPEFKKFESQEQAEQERILQTSPKPHPIRGIISSLLLVIFVLGLIAAGVVYFIYQSKTSQNAFNESGSSDYRMNDTILAAATSGWVSTKYKQLAIKYPNKWVEKKVPVPVDGVTFTSDNTGNTAIIAVAELASQKNISTCSAYLQNLGQLQTIFSGQQNVGVSVTPAIAKKVSFNHIDAQMNVITSGISACFNVRGNDYYASLMEKNDPNHLHHFRDFVLFLNSINSN